MLRVGVLGAGFMGSTHARAYAKLAGARVAAIVSRRSDRAEKLVAEVGGRAYTDPAAVLEDPSIDIVDVSYPTHEHARLAVAALRAGKHVLLEKPIALTLEDADGILAAWRESGRKLMIAHVLRFWPEYVALREAILSGKLGRPFAASAYRLQQSPSWSELFQNPALTGGSVVDLQIHDDDALNWLLGQPRSVFCRGARASTGSWNHAITTISYDGASAVAEGSSMIPAGFPFSAGLRVACERGAVEYAFRAAGESFEMGNVQNGVVVYEHGQAPRQAAVRAPDGYEAEVAYFVRCIERDEPTAEATPEDARLALAVALAARQSLETGETVRL